MAARCPSAEGCGPRAQAPIATVAPELQKIGFERGWGDTVGSTLDTMHLLGELLQVGRTPLQLLPVRLCGPAPRSCQNPHRKTRQ